MAIVRPSYMIYLSIDVSTVNGMYNEYKVK